MQPGIFDVPLRRNAVAPMRLQFFAKDQAEAEVPMDITDLTVKLEVRLYPGQPGAALLSLSTGNHIDIIDAATGVVEVNWPAVHDAIRALPTTAEAGDPTQRRIDTFAYDLLLIAENGDAQAVLEGTIPVSFGVTTA